MGGVRSALEEYQATQLAEITDAEVEEGFAELQRGLELVQAERLRWLAEIDRRRTYAADGHLSTTSWLVSRHRIGGGEASGEVRMARALEQMPASREALTQGEVSASAVRLLAQARESDPEAFGDSETLLLEAARVHSVKDLGRAVAYWRSAAESKRSAEEDDRMWRRRRLHASPTVFGMVRIDGDLDPDTGETVLTALRSCVDAAARSGDPSDDRTPAQRRADALGEICRRWLDHADRPEVGGERPHLTVTVSLEALQGAGGEPCEADHTGPITSEAARRRACDASVARVVLGPRSEPLDVGRRTPVVSAAIRRAVMIRDRLCRFPGCDRPGSWCEPHHIKHWAQGGPTSLHNLVLICRRHHRMVHEGGFQIEMVDGGPAFRRPDGTMLEDRAPP
jgi:uncharacterized protein DUF222/HNH endonuclease